MSETYVARARRGLAFVWVAFDDKHTLQGTVLDSKDDVIGLWTISYGKPESLSQFEGVLSTEELKDAILKYAGRLDNLEKITEGKKTGNSQTKEGNIMANKTTTKQNTKANTKNKANNSTGKKASAPIVPDVVEPIDYAKGRVDAAPVTLATYDSKTTSIGFSGGALQMVKDIATRTDEELELLLRNINVLETNVFVVTGAVCYEIATRALKEGFKQEKVIGGGLNALFNAVSRETGIDGNTLWINYKIYEEFGVAVLKEQLENDPEKILPKEFYKQALRYDVNPIKALTYFEDKRAAMGGSYNMLHAKRDIDKLKAGKTIKQVDNEDLKERKDAVQAKQIAKTTSKKVADAARGEAKIDMVNLQIQATRDNAWRVDQLIASGMSFEAWFIKKCDEQFGVPPVPQAPEQTVFLDDASSAAA